VPIRSNVSTCLIDGGLGPKAGEGGRGEGRGKREADYGLKVR